MRDRDVERLDRLGRAGSGRCRRSCPRSSPAARMPVSSKYLSMANRHAFMTSVSNDVSGRRMSTPAGDQGRGPARSSWRPSGRRSRRGGRGRRRRMPIESCLLVGPMLPATNRGLSGVAPGELVGGAAGELGGRRGSARRRAPPGRTRPATSAVGVERVGLDDVGAGFEVGAVDVLDQLRLGQDQDLGAVLEVDACRWNRPPR